MKAEGKFHILLFEFFVFLMLVLIGLVVFEINRTYDIMELKQPFQVGRIVDGKLVPSKTFALGENIYTKFCGVKKLQYPAKVYLTIEDTFRYDLKPYEINSLVGKVTSIGFVPTSQSWRPGKYRVVGSLVYQDVGFLERKISYPLQSEEFELR